MGRQRDSTLTPTLSPGRSAHPSRSSGRSAGATPLPRPRHCGAWSGRAALAGHSSPVDGRRARCGRGSTEGAAAGITPSPGNSRRREPPGHEEARGVYVRWTNPDPRGLDDWWDSPGSPDGLPSGQPPHSSCGNTSSDHLLSVCLHARSAPAGRQWVFQQPGRTGSLERLARPVLQRALGDRNRWHRPGSAGRAAPPQGGTS